MKKLIPQQQAPQTFDGWRQLPQQQQKSAITDWAETEQADLTAMSGTLDSIASGILGLNAQILAFQNSPGTLAPADQAALDGIVAASAALVAKGQGIAATAAGTVVAPPVTTGP